MAEQTLVFIKPDGVRRKLVGQIIGRFESKGLEIKSLRMMTLTSTLADQHYAEHVEKGFYPRLKEFILSGPIIVMLIEGENAISMVRKMVGATNSAEAEPGSIRGDLSVSMQDNLVHASDSAESAKREIGLFFGEG